MAHGDRDYIGLKQSIIEAKEKAAIATGNPPPDTGPNSYIAYEAEYIADAILECLVQANFSVKTLKAPVIVETFKLPEQLANVAVETLLGEYGPLLKTLKQIAEPLGLGSVIDSLEEEIRKAVSAVVEGGAVVPPTDVSRDDGGLDSTGYVFIGEPPDSQDDFDVEDDEGKQEHTEVVLFREDAERLK